MPIIAIDITPMLPGGENGGAKILVLELLKLFSTVRKHHFILLTSSWNDEELSLFDGPNIKRLCVINEKQIKNQSMFLKKSRIFSKCIRRINYFWNEIKQTYFCQNQFLKSKGVDLLFCPFTAPTFADPNIPVVSVIHDLQHLEYPQFFEQQEIEHRNSLYRDVCTKADSIVCVSHHVRETVLKLLNISEEKLFTIPNSIHKRFSGIDSKNVNRELEYLGIAQRPYMFYPANFWPHKNHQMLLTAYNMFLSRNKDNQTDLVLTGALNEKQEELKQACQKMGLTSRVHFLGFLTERQLSAVYRCCDFLIFPSLYEGFGIPLLEAMAFGKPVLCSNKTSLPEIAGEAALYFDPRNPSEIVHCLEKAIRDMSLRQKLIKMGFERSSIFSITNMVTKYLEIFNSTINKPARGYSGMMGVFEDSWTGKKIKVTYGPGPDNRELELRFEAPLWIPAQKIKLTLFGRGHFKYQKWKIPRGEQISIRLKIGKKPGMLSFHITPVFRPSEHDLGEDNRTLGLICHECRIISSKEEIVFFKGGISCPQP